jgi:hypothetical protein
MKKTTIITVVIVILLIYILYTYWSGKTKLSGLSDAKIAQTISSDKIGSTTSNNFSYSIWYYIDDWNYRYGEPKVIFGKLDDNAEPSPAVTLMPMQNNIQITIGTYDSSDNDSSNTDSGNSSSNNDNSQNSGISVNTSFSTSNTGTANGAYNNDNTTSSNTIEGMSLNSNTSTTASSVSSNNSTSNGSTGAGFSLGSNVSTCMVGNVPLQKWVNLLISLYGRSLDVYLDGKLVKTCVLPGVAKINTDADVHVTPNGGFSGYTSGLQYWNDSKNPQEAWNIYKKGFGGSALGNLFNKYRIKVSFLEDNKEQGSFEV